MDQEQSDDFELLKMQSHASILQTQLFAAVIPWKWKIEQVLTYKYLGLVLTTSYNHINTLCLRAKTLLGSYLSIPSFLQKRPTIFSVLSVYKYALCMPSTYFFNADACNSAQKSWSLTLWRNMRGVEQVEVLYYCWNTCTITL